MTVRYLRVLAQAGDTTFTKRLLTIGNDEDTLNALNTAYPEVYFFQVLEAAEMQEGEIIRFVD